MGTMNRKLLGSLGRLDPVKNEETERRVAHSPLPPLVWAIGLAANAGRRTGRRRRLNRRRRHRGLRHGWRCHRRLIVTTVTTVTPVMLVHFVLGPAIMVMLAAIAMLAAVHISHLSLLLRVQTIWTAHSLCRSRHQDRNKRNRKCSREDESQTTCHHNNASFAVFQHHLMPRDRPTLDSVSRSHAKGGCKKYKSLARRCSVPFSSQGRKIAARAFLRLF